MSAAGRCTRPAFSRRLGIAVAAQELRQLAKELQRTLLVGEHQLCHHAVIVIAASASCFTVCMKT